MAVLGQGRAVSLEVEPMSLDKALTKVASATGMKLGTTSGMKNTVVQISVTDVEPDALLTRLASVTGGTWRSENDGTFRLYEDVERTRQLAREALAARTKAFEEEIAKLKKELDESGEFDLAKMREQAGIVTETSNDGSEQRVETRIGGPGMRFNPAAMPGGRAIVRAIAAMNARDFASIAEGQRVVFSSAPTAMQRRKGGTPLKDAQTFLNEEQQARNSMPRRGPAGRPGANPEANRPEQPPTLGKIFLIANADRDSLRLEYFVASTTGETIGRGFLTLGQGQQFSFARPMPGDAAPAKPAQDGLEISAASKEAAHALYSVRGAFGRFMAAGLTVSIDASGNEDVMVFEPQLDDDSRKPAGASLLEKLTRPSEYDPLSLFAGEVLKAVLGDVDTVACLPDSLLAHAAATIVREQSAKEFLDGGASLVHIEDKDGWTLVSPKDLLRSRAERADRYDLELLAKNTAKNGVMGLADLARYSLDAPALPGGVDSAVVSAIDPGASNRFDDVYGDSRAALQVFGKLQGPDFAALEQRIAKPIVGLSGATQAVAGMVFNSDDGPRVQRQTPPASVPGPVVQNRAIELDIRGGGNPGQIVRGLMNRTMLDERTEVLPTGLPSGGALTMQVDRRDVLYAFSQSGGNGRYTTAQQLGREAAMRELFAEQGGNFPGLGNRQTESYVPTTETRYTLTFLLAPNVTMTRTLVDPAKADTSKGSSVNLLPDQYRLVYQKAYDEAKARVDARGRQREGRRAAGNPPPPMQ